MKGRDYMELLKTRENSKGTKTVICGDAGIGKTTLASTIPGAIILDAEDGAGQVDCTRTPVPKNYAEVKEMLRDLYTNATQYELKTLVIDSIDKVEAMAITDMLESDPKHPRTIEQFDGGYGKGYTAIASRMEDFTKIMDSFRAKGINVVLICHAKIVHIDNPDTLTPYDTYALNLTKQTRPVITAWADNLLYIKREMITTTTQTHKTKAVNSERVIITECTPAFPDTKNRFGLPARTECTYEAIKEAFRV